MFLPSTRQSTGYTHVVVNSNLTFFSIRHFILCYSRRFVILYVITTGRRPIVSRSPSSVNHALIIGELIIPFRLWMMDRFGGVASIKLVARCSSHWSYWRNTGVLFLALLLSLTLSSMRLNYVNSQ